MYSLKTPEAPLALTTFGIVPFLAPAGLMLRYQDDPIFMSTAGLWLIAYAAVILSFLGGVRWGVEIVLRDKPRFAELTLSVLGALVGWALVLVYFQFANPYAFLGSAVALLLHFVIDRASPEMPLWYRKLRIWPTSAAIVCLLVAFYLFSRV
ncbi:MAG: DUF3429 domain-containing protein [Pseudomonadota bacterium]